MIEHVTYVVMGMLFCSGCLCRRVCRGRMRRRPMCVLWVLQRIGIYFVFFSCLIFLLSLLLLCARARSRDRAGREDAYLELGDTPIPEILRVNLAQVRGQGTVMVRVARSMLDPANIARLLILQRTIVKGSKFAANLNLAGTKYSRQERYVGKSTLGVCRMGQASCFFVVFVLSGVHGRKRGVINYGG